MAADAAYRHAMYDVMRMPEWAAFHDTPMYHSDIERHFNTDESFEFKVAHYVGYKAMLLIMNSKAEQLSGQQIDFLQRLFLIDDPADITYENLQAAQQERNYYFRVLGHATKHALSIRQARDEIDAIINHQVPTGITNIAALWELRRRFNGTRNQAQA